MDRISGPTVAFPEGVEIPFCLTVMEICRANGLSSAATVSATKDVGRYLFEAIAKAISEDAEKN